MALTKGDIVRYKLKLIRRGKSPNLFQVASVSGAKVLLTRAPKHVTYWFAGQHRHAPVNMSTVRAARTAELAKVGSCV